MVQFIENLEGIAHEYLSDCGVSYSTRGVWRFLMACDHAKTDLMERMNGVTVSKTVKAEVSKSDIENELQEFFYGVKNYKDKGYRDFCHIGPNYYTYAESFYTQLASTPEVFRSGTIDQRFIDRVLARAYNEGEQPKLRNGMKIGRAFRICLLADSVTEAPSIAPENVEKLSQSFSRVIEALKVKESETGTEEVFLSVNPIDFLNMSNGYSWDSCHKLGDHGDDIGMHAQGVLSYAMCPGIMIAYVKQTVTGQLKWRQVIYSDLAHGLAVGSRQYPGRRLAYEDAVIELIQELYGKAMKVKKGLDSDEVTKYLYEAESDAEFGYCDAHHGMGDGHYFSLTDGDYPYGLHTNAESIYCLDCGDHIYTNSQNQILCDDCHEAYTCYHCGGVHHADDLTDVGGDLYCEDCRDELFIYCERCNCYEDRSESQDVIGYYRDHEVWCEDCVNSFAFWCEDCCEYYAANHHEEYYVNDVCHSVCGSCFDENYFKCAECGEVRSLDNAQRFDGEDDYYCEDCFADICPDSDEDEGHDETPEVPEAPETPELDEGLVPEVGDYIQVHDLAIFNQSFVNLKVGDFAMIREVRTYADGDIEIMIDVPYHAEHPMAQTHYATQRLFASHLTNSATCFKALAGYVRNVATLVKRRDFNRRYALKPGVYTLNANTKIMPEVATNLANVSYVMIENSSYHFTIENPSSVYSQSVLFLDTTTQSWVRQYVRISTLINGVDCL